MYIAPQIHKVVLNKFDQESLSEALQQVKDLPVKLFINCKNSKRKAQTSLRDHGKYTGRRDEAREDMDASADEIISREEVYFTSKENIEGFACLVNVFIK